VQAEVEVVVHLAHPPMHAVAGLHPDLRAEGRVGAEDGRGAEPPAHRPEVSADVEPSAERSGQAAGAVELAGARDDVQARIVGEGVLDAFEPVRLRAGVGVEAGDQLAACGVVAGGGRGGDAHQRLGHDAGTAGARHRGRVVRARIVDDHDLVGGAGLAGEPQQALGEHRGVVPGGDDDGDPCHLCSFRPGGTARIRSASAHLRA